MRIQNVENRHGELIAACIFRVVLLSFVFAFRVSTPREVTVREVIATDRGPKAIGPYYESVGLDGLRIGANSFRPAVGGDHFSHGHLSWSRNSKSENETQKNHPKDTEIGRAS